MHTKMLNKLLSCFASKPKSTDAVSAREPAQRALVKAASVAQSVGSPRLVIELPVEALHFVPVVHQLDAAQRGSFRFELHLSKISPPCQELEIA